MMAKEIIRLGVALSVCVAAIGCKPEPAPAPQPVPATQTAPAAIEPADEPTTKPTEEPATKPTAEPADGPATKPAGTKPVNIPGTSEVGSNPQFTLPPSKGPAAHKFKQVTLLREGPSGDLEMQLTGDGIYRVRDHGRGKSYTGSGKLTDEQIGEWAELFKDWESLKESYAVEPAPKDADKVQIIYGGKKVTFHSPGKDNPEAAEKAYKRLLALSEKTQEASAAADAAGTDTADIPEKPFGDTKKK